jgi:hypothetical protein
MMSEVFYRVALLHGYLAEGVNQGKVQVAMRTGEIGLIGVGLFRRFDECPRAGGDLPNVIMEAPHQIDNNMRLD